MRQRYSMHSSDSFREICCFSFSLFITLQGITVLEIRLNRPDNRARELFTIDIQIFFFKSRYIRGSERVKWPSAVDELLRARV